MDLLKEKSNYNLVKFLELEMNIQVFEMNKNVLFNN